MPQISSISTGPFSISSNSKSFPRSKAIPQVQRGLAVCVIFLAVIASNSRAAEADILLKGGTILDGTGGKPYEGNVAIQAGRIVAVGPDAAAATAKQTIDCKGLLICP